MFNIFTKLYNLFNGSNNKIIFKRINKDEDEDDGYIADNEEDTFDINDKRDKGDKGNKDNDDTNGYEFMVDSLELILLKVIKL
jgi:hypothetical protein